MVCFFPSQCDIQQEVGCVLMHYRQGWRFQIPALVDMGLRVVAPDMMGYGATVSTTEVVESLRMLVVVIV